MLLTLREIKSKTEKFFSEKGNWSLENFENIDEQNRNSIENQVAIGV